MLMLFLLFFLSSSWTSSQPSCVDGEAHPSVRPYTPLSWFPLSICSSFWLACIGWGQLALFHNLRSFGMPPLLPLHLSYFWWPSSSTSWLACMQVRYLLVKKVALLVWCHGIARGRSSCWGLDLVSMYRAPSHKESWSPNHIPASVVSKRSCEWVMYLQFASYLGN